MHGCLHGVLDACGLLPSPPLRHTSSSPPSPPPQAEGGIVAVLTELRLGPSTDPRAASFSSSESTGPPTSSSEGVRHGLDALEARMGEHSDFLRQCGTWSKLLSHTSITALLQVRGTAVCMGGGVQADVSQGNREGGRAGVLPCEHHGATAGQFRDQAGSIGQGVRGTGGGRCMP